MKIRNEVDLVNICLHLIDQAVLSPSETEFIKKIPFQPPHKATLKAVRQAIAKGTDPLGDAFSEIRSASDRRNSGAVYTPLPIVQSMLRWLLQQQPCPTRIVDPGAGSGRFIIEAARMLPEAYLVAVEVDPLAALMLRTNLNILGYSDRTTIIVEDYRDVNLPTIDGITAFIGNPPYVRHHEIEEEWKKWYSRHFASFGIKASALAGLHLHFFLKTRLLANEGDCGAFITSAEWMDVNYGSSLRKLLLEELGGVALHVLEPSVEAFPGTATTAAITCFRVGEHKESLRVRSVDTLSYLNCLSGGVEVPRGRFEGEAKWSIIIRPSNCHNRNNGEIELGELFRVHRGQVTGANDVWIAGEYTGYLPECVLHPSVTKAKDLLTAGESLTTADGLRRVIDIPPDLDSLSQEDRRYIDKFLSWARLAGAHQSYIAQHRKAWWSVGLKAPAPILCTYMARRPPQFTLNVCAARHINIAHGLYPVEPIGPTILSRIVTWLNQNISTANGRTYAGGLTKFEPKEVERLHIPSPGVFA